MNRVMCAAVMAIVVTVSPAGATTFSCTPGAANLNNPTPLHLSDDDIAGLERSYRAPEVRGLRTAIETYLAGDAKPRAAKLLKLTPQIILRRRFRLMADAPGIGGGYFLVIQFKDHPEAMYRAWVYDVGDEWDLRAWDAAHCSLEQQRWLRTRYGLITLSVSG